MKEVFFLSGGYQIIIVIVLVVVITAIILYKNKEKILEKKVRKIIQAESPLKSLKEGLHVLLLGTGSPMPDRSRAGTSTIILAGDKVFVVDVGDGSMRNTQLIGFDNGTIDAVFLTHYHSDHIASLGEFMLNRWVGAKHTEPLDIYGPPGIESVVKGFNEAYKLDSKYRTQHHGEDFAPPSGAGGNPITFELDEKEQIKVILEEDGLKVTAFKVEHPPIKPAVGYKFEYRGKSVVVSGDTNYNKLLVEQAQNVDLLIHDALSVDMVKWINQYSTKESTRTVTQDIPDYHASPEEAAKLAQKANVGHLVLSHIIPPLPSILLEKYFLKKVGKLYHGEITLAKDGMLISMFKEESDDKVRNLIS